MKNFFLASILIFILSLLIVFYYWSKQKIKNKKYINLKYKFYKKLRTDEREYLRNFIAYFIPLLIDNKVQWILIWSKLAPDYKTEITYNSLSSLIQIGAGNISSLQEFKEDLTELGANRFGIKYDKVIINLLPNAKIITDLLYYVFENIYNLKDFSNHKIVTS